MLVKAATGVLVLTTTGRHSADDKLGMTFYKVVYAATYFPYVFHSSDYTSDLEALGE